MGKPRYLRRLTGRRSQLAVFGGVATLCLVATIYLGLKVTAQLERYGNARGDNVLWTLTQLEVDHAKLTNAVTALGTSARTDTSELRIRFDVFYSRAHTLRESPAYQSELEKADSTGSLDRILAGLDRMTAIIDTGETAIRNGRDQLLDELTALAPLTRELALFGVAADDRTTLKQRTELIDNLRYVTALSLVMLAALLSLLALFWRLYRRYRKRAMENRKTVNRMSTILNTSQDVILVVDPKGRIVDSNTAAHRLFGIDKASKMDIASVVSRRDDDDVFQPLSGQRLFDACAQGPKLCSRLRARDRSGRVFPIEMSADRGTRGGDDVCVCFLRDISERAAAESEMRNARDRALAGERAKASFLGMVSHEMRTPLNGILGALDLMQDTKLTEEQARYARIMQSSGQLVLNQVNDALDFTQAEGESLTFNRDPFDLDLLLDDLIASQRPQAEQSGTVLRLERPTGGIGRVIGDARRLHQVLLNLISNALKFTEGGSVSLEVSRRSDGAVIDFQVSDTGCGIAEADLPRVFDDFVRLDTVEGQDVEGTGLGLGIARRLARLMGGEIGAESIPGEGSLFWVALPLPRTTPTSAATSQPHAVPSQPNTARDILIVEDNATNRFVLHEMLTKQGHKVVTAETGEAAIDLTENRRFDLIFMDICMPGLNGIETTRRIRESGGASASARIIALTAHFQPEADEALRHAGFDAIHGKPLRLTTLRAVLAGSAESDAAAERAPSSPETLDTVVLDQLADVLPKEKLGAMVQAFLDEGQEFVTALDAFRTLTTDQQQYRLHHLAGSAATFGAAALQALLARAEAALARGDRVGAERALNSLPMLWQATYDAIANRRADAA